MPNGNGTVTLLYTITAHTDLGMDAVVTTTDYPPVASDQIQLALDAGASVGTIVTTVGGYDRNDQLIAEGIFVWAADFNINPPSLD